MKLHEAAQQALEALEGVIAAHAYEGGSPVRARDALRAALAEATIKESLPVPDEIAATITTTDIAWLETRRMTKLWQELGQMRWAGADEGWDLAIAAVRSRLNDECQSVLDWKAKVDQSNATAIELLKKMQELKHE